MMKRVFFLCISGLFALFLLCGCQTITGTLLDPEVPLPAIKTTYPYKFYVSSMQFYANSNVSRKLEYEDEQIFIDGVRSKLAALYPGIFTASPSEPAIPITYNVVFSPPEHEIKVMLMSFVMVPFVAVSVYSGGFFPTYMYCGVCSMDVRVNVAKNINFSCQRKVFQHIRANMGLLGFLNTRKLLPDISDGDVPTQDGSPFSPAITTSEYSEKFLNLLVYALQEVDHEQVLKLYNEKYRPREDFILP